MAWSADHARQNRLPREWHRLRAIVLNRDPICRICNKAPSTDVDHIIPLLDDHRPEALQGLCRPCHRSKTARDSHARRPNRRRAAAKHPGLL